MQHKKDKRGQGYQSVIVTGRVDSWRRKFQALANKEPGIGTTRPHHTIARAKELWERTASITNGSNTAEDDAAVGDFFEETEEQYNPNLLLDLERGYFSPEQTPIFVTSCSRGTEHSEMA